MELFFRATKFSGGGCLPPRGVESEKRKRQYEHIKESELKRASEEDAERIAAATTNKTRREKGETES
jgi:hypothetical protein